MTTFLVPKNNANGKLNADITDVATSLTLQSGEGARFPSTYPFHISIDNEILKCTNRSDDTLTVTRAQESTSAAAHSAGVTVAMNVTAQYFTEIQDAVGALAATQVLEAGLYDDMPAAATVGRLYWTTDGEKLYRDNGASWDLILAKLDLDGVTLEALGGPEQVYTAYVVPGGISIDDLANTNKSARVTHNAAQSIPTATNTALAFNTERWDTDTIHDTSTNNSRLTCKTAGKYLIAGHVLFAGHATGQRQLSVRLNGATYCGIVNHISASAAVQSCLSISTVLDLAVNDYVELVALQTSGGDLNISQANNYTPEFMMIKIA